MNTTNMPRAFAGVALAIAVVLCLALSSALTRIISAGNPDFFLNLVGVAGGLAGAVALAVTAVGLRNRPR